MFVFLEKAMTQLSTPLYILTILTILAGCGVAAFLAYKLVILVINMIQNITTNKKLKVGKDGIELANERDEETKPSTTLENEDIKVVEDNSQTFSEESLVTLIYEMQDLFDDYYDKKRDLKLQTLSDQLKKFESEKLTFIFLVQEKYLNSLSKTENSNSYNMLFHYWFLTCFNEASDEIRDILQRNHLKEKTSDEFTDIINQLFDTTYSQILSHVETAPNFIINHIALKNVIIGYRNEYRNYLDHSLQNAKKISEKAANDKKLLEEDFNAKKSDIVHRVFPTVDSDKIAQSLKKE